MPTLDVTKFLALNFTDSWLNPTPELILERLLLTDDPVAVIPPESCRERFVDLGEKVLRTGRCRELGSIESFRANPGGVAAALSVAGTLCCPGGLVVMVGLGWTGLD